MICGSSTEIISMLILYITSTQRGRIYYSAISSAGLDNLATLEDCLPEISFVSLDSPQFDPSAIRAPVVLDLDFNQPRLSPLITATVADSPYVTINKVGACKNATCDLEPPQRGQRLFVWSQHGGGNDATFDFRYENQSWIIELKRRSRTNKHNRRNRLSFEAIKQPLDQIDTMSVLSLWEDFGISLLDNAIFAALFLLYLVLILCEGHSGITFYVYLATLGLASSMVEPIVEYPLGYVLSALASTSAVLAVARPDIIWLLVARRGVVIYVALYYIESLTALCLPLILGSHMGMLVLSSALFLIGGLRFAHFLLWTGTIGTRAHLEMVALIVLHSAIPFLLMVSQSHVIRAALMCLVGFVQAIRSLVGRKARDRQQQDQDSQSVQTEQDTLSRDELQELRVSRASSYPVIGKPLDQIAEREV